MNARTPFNDLPPSQQAGILCVTEDFQRYIALRIMPEDTDPAEAICNEAAAAAEIRYVCGITSRRALDTDTDASAKFHQLRTDYDAWRGKIAAQR